MNESIKANRPTNRSIKPQSTSIPSASTKRRKTSLKPLKNDPRTTISKHQSLCHDTSKIEFQMMPPALGTHRSLAHMHNSPTVFDKEYPSIYFVECLVRLSSVQQNSSINIFTLLWDQDSRRFLDASPEQTSLDPSNRGKSRLPLSCSQFIFLTWPFAPPVTGCFLTTAGTLNMRGQTSSNSSCRPFRQWRNQMPQTM